MTCITEILALKGDKEFIIANSPRDEYGIVIEGGGHYKGYEYLITFTSLGHRCGYVALPKDHLLANEDLDLVNDPAPEPYDELEVHGGITLHDKGTHILKRLFPDREQHCNHIWIGFDAAHNSDGRDFEYYEKYFGKDRADVLRHNSYDFELATIKTYDYMEGQCKHLIDQLRIK